MYTQRIPTWEYLNPQVEGVFLLLLFLNFNSIHILKQHQEANAPHDKRKRKPYPVSKEINHTKIIFFPLLLWALLLMVSYGRIVRRSSVYQTMLVCTKHLSEWSCEKAICWSCLTGASESFQTQLLKSSQHLILPVSSRREESWWEDYRVPWSSDLQQEESCQPSCLSL